MLCVIAQDLRRWPQLLGHCQTLPIAGVGAGQLGGGFLLWLGGRGVPFRDSARGGVSNRARGPGWCQDMDGIQGQGSWDVAMGNKGHTPRQTKRAVLRAPGPSGGAGSSTGTGPQHWGRRCSGVGTDPLGWCRHHCGRLDSALVQGALQALAPGVGAGTITGKRMNDVEDAGTQKYVGCYPKRLRITHLSGGGMPGLNGCLSSSKMLDRRKMPSIVK